MITNLTESQLLESINLTFSRMENNKDYLIDLTIWNSILEQLQNKNYSTSDLYRYHYVFRKENNKLLFNRQVIDRTNVFTLAFALSFFDAVPLPLAFALAFITGKLEGLLPTEAQPTTNTRPKNDFLELY